MWHGLVSAFSFLHMTLEHMQEFSGNTESRYKNKKLNYSVTILRPLICMLMWNNLGYIDVYFI